MNDESPPQKTWKTRLGRLSKWLFFIGAFFLIILTVLGNIGGNSDELRSSVEQYIQSATGYHTRVKTLNKMAFFPDMIFDFEGTELRTQPNDDFPVATIERVHLITGFWSVMFRTGKVKALYIDGLTAQPGVVTQTALKIDKIHVDDTLPGADNAALKFAGTLGKMPIRGEIGVAAHRKNRWKTSYSLAPEKGFSFELDDLLLSGTLSTENDKTAINNLRLAQNNVDVFTGTLYPARDAVGNMRVTGDLKLTQHGTQLKPDFFVVREQAEDGAARISTTGILKGIPFIPDDFKTGSRLNTALVKLNAVFGTPTLDALLTASVSLSDIQKKDCIEFSLDTSKDDIIKADVLAPSCE